MAKPFPEQSPLLSHPATDGTGGCIAGPQQTTPHGIVPSADRFIYTPQSLKAMKLVATIKVRLDHPSLAGMASSFTEAVQHCIDRGFSGKVSNRFALHHLAYREIRTRLPADFATEAIGKASEILKSTKHTKRPIMKGQTISFDRKLFTFTPEKIRMATFIKGKREEISIFIPLYYRKYLDWEYRTLEYKGGWGHVTFSKEADIRPSCGNEVVGVDLGIKNLAVTSDGRFFPSPRTRIKQYHFLRRRLQRKDTKSAKRHLRMLRGRQKRYMRDINHCVSKDIVKDADIIVLEDLKGIRKGKTKYKGSKRQNRWLHGWSFCQLRQFIEYKAAFAGKTVNAIDPAFSSQECSACGKLGSRVSSSFVCPHCGNALDADLNASCTLRRRHVNTPNVSNHSLGTSPASKMRDG